MTIEEKASQMQSRRTGHSPAGSSRVQLVERGSSRRRLRRHGDCLSAGDRAGGDLGPELFAGFATTISTGGAREATTRPMRDGSHGRVRRAHVLVAEHQHLPRSALGAWPGDIWRRSVPDLEARCGVRSGPARRRPEVSEGRLDAEALRRPQRAGARTTSVDTASRS